MEPIEFGKNILIVGALVWAIVQALKGMIPLKPQFLALVFSIVLGGLGVYSGYLAGNWFEQVALVVLAALTASAVHRIAWRQT